MTEQKGSLSIIHGVPLDQRRCDGSRELRQVPISISLIVPVYNRERFICEALDSIAAQTRLPDELVIVDDGSTDESVPRIEDWMYRHSHVNSRLLRQENAGAAAARNTGIRHCTGDHVAFLDSDDLLLPHSLQTLADVMQRCPEDLVMCVGDKKVIETENGKVWKLRRSAIFDSQLLAKLDLRPDPITGCLIAGPGLFQSLLPGSFITLDSALIRKSAALDVGLFPVQFKTSEDRLFFLRIVRSGKVALIRDPVSITRLHDQNLTSDAASLEVAKNALAALEFVRDTFELSSTERVRVLELIKVQRKILRYWASTKGRVYFKFALTRLLRNGDLSFLHDVRCIGRALLGTRGIRQEKQREQAP